MTASQLFQAGRLREAIDTQTQEVKANPADPKRRLFLFELLAFAGDLERARRQIDAVNFGQVEMEAAVLAYAKLLDAEQARRRLFSEGLKPQFFGEPSDHVRLRLEAVNRLREGQSKEAAETLARAAEAFPALKGKLNGREFQSLRDCDDLFAGVLEVMAHGAYYWVPLDQVIALGMNTPRYPRDLLWLPARLTLADGGQGEVFLPTLYPGSHEHPDDEIKLGRKTDWKGEEGGPVLGIGCRDFLVGEEVIGLLEWRELEIG
jgi:type VI secretion system protein ImpE